RPRHGRGGAQCLREARTYALRPKRGSPGPQCALDPGGLPQGRLPLAMMYRGHLPQLDGDPFLTDGGIETVLIFREGIDLPRFAAFDLLRDGEGTDRLRRYYAPYVELARERGIGFVLESPTWRASPRWASELGQDADELDRLNRSAIALLE